MEIIEKDNTGVLKINIIVDVNSKDRNILISEILSFTPDYEFDLKSELTNKIKEILKDKEVDWKLIDTLNVIGIVSGHQRDVLIGSYHSKLNDDLEFISINADLADCVNCIFDPE